MSTLTKRRRACGALLACAASATVSFPAALAAPGKTIGHWVTGWEAPAIGSQGLYVGAPPAIASYAQGFADQTLRLIITPHAAGTRARIVLSNVFGSKTVNIIAATIAIRARGATLVRGTLRTLTFHGGRSVSIPAGRQVLSDPAGIRIAPFRDLAVSLAFRARTGPPTYHYNGLQTSYLSPRGSGNRSAAVAGGAFTSTTPMRFFLTELRVLAARPARTLVAVGDSITDGGNYGPDTANRNARWPDFLQRRLLAARSSLSVANAGISANEVTQPSVIPEGGPGLEQRFGRDVLSEPNLGGIIVLEGINDIGLSGASASTVIDGLKRIAKSAHATGVPIMIGTLLPFQGAFYYTAAKEKTRAQVNDWIRDQHLFDGVIDFAAAVKDAADPARLRARYDSGDHLHPNAEGFQAMAQAINLSVVVARARAGRPKGVPADA